MLKCIYTTIGTLELEIDTPHERYNRYWGWEQCPDDSWVSAFRLRIQPENATRLDTGRPDVGVVTVNTALNSIELRCTDIDGVQTRYG